MLSVMFFGCTIYYPYQEAKKAEAVAPLVGLAAQMVGSVVLSAAGAWAGDKLYQKVMVRHRGTPNLEQWITQAQFEEVDYQTKNEIINTKYGGVDPYRSGTSKIYRVGNFAFVMISSLVGSIIGQNLVQFLLGEDEELPPGFSLISGGVGGTVTGTGTSYVPLYDLRPLNIGDNVEMYLTVSGLQSGYNEVRAYISGTPGGLGVNTSSCLGGVTQGSTRGYYVKATKSSSTKCNLENAWDYEPGNYLCNVNGDGNCLNMYVFNNTTGTHGISYGAVIKVNGEIQERIAQGEVTVNDNGNRIAQEIANSGKDAYVVVPNDLNDLNDEKPAIVTVDGTATEPTPTPIHDNTVDWMPDIWQAIKAIPGQIQSMFTLNVNLQEKADGLKQKLDQKVPAGEIPPWMTSQYWVERECPKWYFTNPYTQQTVLFINWCDYIDYIGKMRQWCAGMVAVFTGIWFVRLFRPQQSID